ncbi:MAG TPA: efflux RND transporter permease subunit, partial [Paraburkholderia sp.]|uniref:efflux RND transporter permease subunit n=1 Tax=Paraburkholderia sp. TaxID=1926495 RepID=UPI002B477682
MLNAIIRFSLRFRGVIYALAVITAGYGLYSLTRAKLDVFPEFAPPMSIVQTEATGLTSEQVETLVTQPIEDGLGGMVGLQSMRSRSMQGLSAITLVFDDHANVMQIRQLVSERVSALAAILPTGVMPPKLLPLTTTTSVVRTIGLTSQKHSLMELNDIAQWTIKPQLLSVPGVADVIVFGGQTRQMQIQVDAAKLMRYGLSMQDVMSAARVATGVRGAGFIENDNQRIAVNADGQIVTPEKLAAIVLHWSNGAAVRLGDVASVRWGAAPAVGAASIMGQPGVMLVLESQYGTNTAAVTKDIENTLSTLHPVLDKDGIDVNSDVFRPANFIDASVSHLRTALLVGAVLVTAVLFLFLLNVRTALISAVAIPLSLFVAIIVLTSFGVSMNTMTLGGLAIALGEVVDDAIIDVENIYRRLRENRSLSKPLPAFRVVLRASLEVRSAVVFATFIVMLIFLPVLTLSGVAGKLFAPLGVAYIVSILASLVTSVTVTPVLASYLLAGRSAHGTGDSFVVSRLKAGNARLLQWAFRRPRAIYAVVAFGVIAAGVGALALPRAFLPPFNEGTILINLQYNPGISLAESNRLGMLAERMLLDIPEVKSLGRRTGRADLDEHAEGVHNTEIDVDLTRSQRSKEEVFAHIRTKLAVLPVSVAIGQPIAHRLDHMLSGVQAQIVVKVFGADLDTLRASAE